MQLDKIQLNKLALSCYFDLFSSVANLKTWKKMSRSFLLANGSRDTRARATQASPLVPPHLLHHLEANVALGQLILLVLWIVHRLTALHGLNSKFSVRKCVLVSFSLISCTCYINKWTLISRKFIYSSKENTYHSL